MRLITPKSLDLSRRRLLAGSAALSAYAGLSLDALEALAQSPCGNAGPTPPPQASAAGMNTLVLSDDFTSTSTFATTSNQAWSSDVLWYPGLTGNGQKMTIFPTMTAAQVSNGNSSGGINASPNGGILWLQPSPSAAAPNQYDQWLTAAGGSLNHAGAVQPPVGQGNWKHFYYESYLQLNIATSGNISGYWSGAFAWSMNGIGNFGFGSCPIRTDPLTEWDFFESFGTNFNNYNGVCNVTLARHSPTQGENDDGFVKGYPLTGANGPPAFTTATSGVEPYFDNEWHTLGALWEPDPVHVGQGLISMWWDNIQYGPKLSTAGNGSPFPVELSPLFIILGAGGSGGNYYDWVRIWQAP